MGYIFSLSRTAELLSNSANSLFDKWRAALRSGLRGHCLLCGTVAERAGLCGGCVRDLPWLDAAVCRSCAHPLPEPGLCGRCIADPPHYDQVIAACRYAYPLDALIQSYKYRGRLAAASTLAALLAGRIRSRPDLIVPMPLAAQRLRERGFNQALELARIIGRQLNAPVDAGLCIKSRDTAPQTRLPWKARRKNIRGAFVVLGSLEGCHVAVVDDVLTTGATLSELARNLKRAGAARVTGYVVARTVSR
ncbi:MAG: ComF family protein [Burkholderiales bacterium]|nr:ComF family protein [Burkholderiales bacterium]